MFKKAVGFAFILSLILGGCGLSNGSTSSESKNNEVIEDEVLASPITLDIICYEYSENSKDLWQEIKNGFEVQNQNITLNIDVLPWNEANIELDTRLFNNESIDIAVTDDLEKYIESDILIPSSDYTTKEMRTGVLYNIDTSFGMPVAGDEFVLYIKNDVAEVSGINQATIDSVGWDAILHGFEHFSEMGILHNFFVDVNEESLNLSQDVLYKSTREKREGVSSSLINYVLNNKEIRRKTAYDGVLGVISNEIGVAVAPGSLKSVLPKDLSLDNLSAYSLPGEPYVLYDYFAVFKKSGEDEESRLDAVNKFMEYFYSTAYENFLSKEGYISTIKFN